MRRKAVILFLAFLLVVGASALGLAQEGLFPGARERSNGNSDDVGPPDWAPPEALRGWNWSQEGDEGPPPWAPGFAREAWEWSEKNLEGPPPWARGKNNDNDD